MAQYDGGSVLLSVVPVFSGLQKKIAEEARRNAQVYNKSFNEELGRNSAPVPGPAPSESKRRGTESGGAFADGFRAKLEQATRALPKLELKADASEAEKEVQSLRAELASLATKRVGVDIDAATALAEVERISARLRELGASSADVQVKADTAGALTALGAVTAAAKALDGTEPHVEVSSNVGEFATDFRNRIQAATAALPNINIGVAATAAEQEIRDLRAELETLSTKTVGVDIDAAGALAEVKRISLRLRELGAQSPDIQVRADVGEALASLQAVSAAARALDGKGVDLDSTNLNSFTGRVAALATAIAGLGPALIPIGGVAVASLAGIGTGAVAAGAGIGTLLLGISGVSNAVGALNKAQQAQTVSSSAAASQAQALASAQRGLESAEASLANTRANAAQAAIASAKRVADAQQRVTDTEQEAARDIEAAQARVADVAESTAERVTAARRTLADATERAAQDIASALDRQERAERSLADAQVSATQAQDDLVRARKDAQQQIEDLALDVTSAGLRQRQAVLDVADATDRLAKVQRDPTATARDIAQAQLGLEQAQQSLVEIGVRYSRLQSEKAASDAAGVEGSDAVVAANKRVGDATRNVSDAQKAATAAAADTAKAQRDAATSVADAQANLARTQAQASKDQAAAAANLAQVQESTARRISDAQAAVVDAQAAAAEQQRQSAFSVEQATRGVVGAQEALAAASAAGGVSGAKAMDDLREAMAGLSPAGQDFARFLFSLKPQLDELRASAAQNLLPGLTTAIQGLLPVLPSLNGFLASLGGVLGNLAVQASAALTGPGWAPFFEMVSRTAGPALTGFSQAAGSLALALANLLVAFEPLSTAFINELASMAGQFAEFTAGLTSNPAFQSFLAYIVSTAPLVGQFLGALGSAFVTIVQALAPFGPVVLQIATALLNFIAAIPPGVLEAIVLAVVGIVAAFNLLAPVISFVGGIIGAISAGVPVLGAVIAALGGPVTLIIAGLIALGAALFAAYQQSETFRDIVNAAFSAVGDAAKFLWNNVFVPAFQGIGAVIDFTWKNVIKPIFEAYKFYFENVLAPVLLFFWHNVIEPAWTGIKLAIDIAWVAIQIILGAFELFVRAVLAPVFTWLWQNIVKPAFDGIGLVISTVWTTIVRPVLDALGGYIRDTVAPAFQRGVDAIAKAWDGIKEAAKAPVRFVVNTVINDGIIGTFNKVAAQFPGVDPIERIKLPEGFARGGILPGFSRWQNGDDQMVAMRRGEGVAIAEAMAVPALRNELLRWNAIGLAGGTGALQRYAGGSGGGFARGGIIGSLGSLFSSAASQASSIGIVLKAAIADPAAAIADVVRRMLALLPGADTGMGRIAAGVPLGLLDGLKDAVSGIFADASGGDFTGPDAVSRWAPTVLQVLAALGQPASLSGAVLRRIQLESGGNPNAINLYDSNAKAGHPSQGLVQTIPSTFAAYAGPYASRGITDPFANIYAGMAYALKRYGSIAAIDPKVRPVGYDSGGYLQPGFTTVFNGTGKPEPVVLPGVLDEMAKAGAAMRAGAGIGDVYVQSPISGEYLRAYIEQAADGRILATAATNQVRARQGAGAVVLA